MINVTVAWATPTVQDVVSVELPHGATVGDAVAQSRLLPHYWTDATHVGYAIYGRAVTPREPLRVGDRVEITRPLGAGPRQERARRAPRAASDVSQRRTASKRND
jgi:uncharacterized protein